MVISSESPPVVGRRERKKLETRARIRRTAARLFADHGFDTTTVDEIAEAADISRATFFKYFPGKPALIAELGDAMTDSFLTDLEDVRTRGLPTESALAELFATVAARLEIRSDLSRALLYETVARRRDLVERRSQTARMHDGLSALLQDGVVRGEVRSDVPLSLLTETVAGAYLEVLLSWVVDPSYPLGERLRLTATVLGSALSPPMKR